MVQNNIHIGTAGRGRARLGKAGLGKARLGMARQGMARHGSAWRGKARKLADLLKLPIKIEVNNGNTTN